jgi:phosphate starvation-inducible PhoH-like protein
LCRSAPGDNAGIATFEPPSEQPVTVILRRTFEHADNERLLHMCGVLDEHLRRVEESLGVTIRRRQGSFEVEGRKADAERALSVLEQFHARSTRHIAPQAVQLLLAEAAATGVRTPRRDVPTASEAGVRSGVADATAGDGPAEVVLHTRRPDVKARTPNQRRYLRAILDHDIAFGIGPAGTGKTFLAVACAVDALERSQVQRVILTRPAVEAGERLGFLPGDLAQKVDPYLRPLYDALYDLMGFDRVTRAFERGVLEIAPLAFMRGRTLNQAFVILDEAQNTTPEQMKMFLTRIGFGAKAVVTGDTSQIDLPKSITSGLVDAERVLGNVKGIAFTRFTSADVVRHPLVARVVEAYDRHRPDDAAAAGVPERGARVRTRRRDMAAPDAVDDDASA